MKFLPGFLEREREGSCIGSKNPKDPFLGVKDERQRRTVSSHAVTWEVTDGGFEKPSFKCRLAEMSVRIKYKVYEIRHVELLSRDGMMTKAPKPSMSINVESERGPWKFGLKVCF